MGRPSMYSIELAEKICNEISTTSKGLKTISEMEGMPTTTTILRWLIDNKEFNLLYARAKEEQADLLADEIIMIADDTSHDTITTEFGDKPNSEWINRSRLRVDARKWVAAKLKPRKYGDKLDLTTKEESINASALSHLTFDELLELQRGAKSTE